MAIRPPPSNSGDSPDAVTFGIPEVDALLDETDLSFPARAEEVTDALGDADVAYDPQGHTVRLAEALDSTGRSRFETENDLLNALHPVLEDYRHSSSTGFVGWLRSVLPL